MNKLERKLAAAKSVAIGLFTIFAVSCSTRHAGQTSDPASITKERGGFGIPGFEALGSPGARRKQDVLAKFGSPIAKENAGIQMQYEILTYPVRGWEEKLLVYFYGEDLLGFCRERARSTLDSTVRSHQRVQGGRVPLFQSRSNGQTSYFVATREQIEKAPKWTRTSGEPPPLSGEQAETLVSDWLCGSDSDTPGKPRSHRLIEAKSVPGIAFYIVDIGFDPPANMRQIVVLMDGSILAGEFDANP